MANKFVAVFLMCTVVVVAFSLNHEVEATEDLYGSCFNTCQKGCVKDGNGNTFCEIKCDSECTAKENAAKIGTPIV
ncbi:hypothetical protein I3760_08G108600 [Carya illinoinensis]|nr:hypothetical protein I3760_08G108600 [Carya illinoinensis]